MNGVDTPVTVRVGDGISGELLMNIDGDILRQYDRLFFVAGCEPSRSRSPPER